MAEQQIAVDAETVDRIRTVLDQARAGRNIAALEWSAVRLPVGNLFRNDTARTVTVTQLERTIRVLNLSRYAFIDPGGASSFARLRNELLNDLDSLLNAAR